MKEFWLRQIDNDSYSIYLLCLTFDSILNYLDDIERNSLIQYNNGKIIIDQLLVTGNGKNRFISCEFKNGSIILESANNVNPNTSIKTIALESLQSNFEYIQNSILSENQLYKIQNGTFM